MRDPTCDISKKLLPLMPLPPSHNCFFSKTRQQAKQSIEPEKGKKRVGSSEKENPAALAQPFVVK